MDISDWRKKIDDLDRQLVNLMSQRAQAAHEIGKLKRDAAMPIYEPDRERQYLIMSSKKIPGLCRIAIYYGSTNASWT